MRRRAFIAGLAGAAAMPLAMRAQERGWMRRIGVLMVIAESDPEALRRVSAIKDGLRELGWTEGRQIEFDIRWGAGDADRVSRYAAELVARKPDVLVVGGTAPLSALHRQTRDIPIVFAQVGDPIGQGFGASAARPGGNITGFALYDAAIAVKWIELLKQLAPNVTRISLIHDPTSPSVPGYLRTMEPVAAALQMQVSSAVVRQAADVDRIMRTLAGEPNRGLIVATGPSTAMHRDAIIALAAKHQIPAVYAMRYFVNSGGLASYGVDNIDLYRRTASYIDRIFKGEKPGDLPIQYPTKFELVINLKTAKALGIEVPISLLARTDEVIE